jgi:RNA polymerase-binding transcription factor DksA
MATTNSLLSAATNAPSDDADLRRFEAALARIESGTFGLCIDCEQPIERSRIDQMPLAEQCTACAYAETRVIGLA